MPSSTPPPGRPGAPPRRGIGGLVGLLAVLAFVILAAVILTRRAPDQAAPAPPAASAPAPATTLAAASPSPEAPPSTEPAAAVAVASAPPVAPTAATPAGGKPRAPRRGGSTGAGGTRTADAGSRLPAPPPPSGTAPRRFVLGTTSLESLKPVGRDLKGFEPDNVGVKRAPEVNGSVELEMDPQTVRPGVDYKVKVYFRNDGGKDIPVQEMKVQTVENGKSASRTLTPRARNVKPNERVLLSEVEGVWRESARTWAMDVVVTSTRQDVYRNRLRWE
jgi:hypothetical protein